jgi:hypothetical protein
VAAYHPDRVFMKLFFSFIAGSLFALCLSEVIPIIKARFYAPFPMLEELSVDNFLDFSLHSHGKIDLFISNDTSNFILIIDEEKSFMFSGEEVTYSENIPSTTFTLSTNQRKRFASYDLYSETGDFLGINFDGNIDGTIDLKIRKNKAMVQIEKKWYEIQKIGNTQAVSVDGNMFKLESSPSFEYTIGEQL